MSTYIDIKYIKLLSIRLRNFKQKNNNLFNFSCIFCGDSQKNKFRARFYVFEKSGTLIGKCHNCGKTASIADLINHLDFSLYKDYLLEKFSDNNHQRKKSRINIKPPKFDKVDPPDFKTAIKCSDLSPENICKKYLISRKIPEKFWKRLYYTENYQEFIRESFPEFDRIDSISKDKRLIIPVYNEWRELVGSCGRSLTGKGLRYVNVKKYDDIIFGIDRIDFNKKIYITEGPLDSLFIENSLASCNSNLIHVAKYLEEKHIKKKDFVMIFDNEPRNVELVGIMESVIKKDYNVVLWPSNIKEKDINEMIINGKSMEEIKNLIDDNTVNGICGIAKFMFWRK